MDKKNFKNSQSDTSTNGSDPKDKPENKPHKFTETMKSEDDFEFEMISRPLDQFYVSRNADNLIKVSERKI